MSEVDKLVRELQEVHGSGKKQSHIQAVSLDNSTHRKLVGLAASLRVSKTSLASKLLTAAIDDAAGQVRITPVVADPTATAAEQLVADPMSMVREEGFPQPGDVKKPLRR